MIKKAERRIKQARNDLIRVAYRHPHLRDDLLPVIKKAQEQLSDVDIEEGRMHEELGVPKDEDITDHYDSGKQLAEDLVDAAGKKDAAGMINWVANISDTQLYEDAQDALSDIEG